ncbi:glycoside hydrolase family 28 protein [soil metagenome]
MGVTGTALTPASEAGSGRIAGFWASTALPATALVPGLDTISQIIYDVGMVSAGVATATSARMSVSEAGAVGDGATDCTAVIQAVIDRAVAAGGATVYVPAGRYLVGTLTLGSNVCLHLDRGSTLIGSANVEDYPRRIPSLRSYTDNYTCRSVLYAEQAHDIAIIGGGTIDGQGASFLGRPYLERPYLIRFVECERVQVRDIRLRDSAMWVQHYLGCSDVVLDGLTVTSTANINNDGSDIDSSERVRISNCDITTEDDAIVLKATARRSCRDVTISNSVLSSDCNAFKIGTESVGDITDIAVSNCVVRHAGRSGLALETVDGGTLARVVITNVVMLDCVGGIFIRLGHRGRPLEATGTADDHDGSDEGPVNPTGSLRDVLISNVVGRDNDSIGCSITGLPDGQIENITLRAVDLSFAGEPNVGARPDELPELPTSYPEYNMYGPLPAYGLYCRHVHELKLLDVDLRVSSADPRPAVWCDDITVLHIARLSADVAPGVDLVVTHRCSTESIESVIRRPSPF